MTKKLITVAVNGALGRMGQEAVQALEQDPRFDLVGAFTREDDLAAAIARTQPMVVVDFTTPESVYRNLMTCINANVHPMIGTTGLTAEQIRTAQQACEEKALGGIIAPNCSLGALLLMRMAQTAAAYFPNVEIIEYHHPAKKDAPSGTAIKTAELIAAKRQQSPSPATPEQPGRGALKHDIPIHAVRLPGFIASQTVLFGGDQETLSIHHSSTHRQSFMPGVLMACEKVVSLSTLVYGLEQLL